MSKLSAYEALAEYKKFEPLFKAAKVRLLQLGYEEVCTVMANGETDQYGMLFVLENKAVWLNKDTVRRILESHQTQVMTVKATDMREGDVVHNWEKAKIMAIKRWPLPCVVLEAVTTNGTWCCGIDAQMTITR